jgi:hypothetical protein
MQLSTAKRARYNWLIMLVGTYAMHLVVSLHLTARRLLLLLLSSLFAAAADPSLLHCTLRTALHLGQRSSRMPWPLSLPEPLTFGGALRVQQCRKERRSTLHQWSQQQH